MKNKIKYCAGSLILASFFSHALEIEQATANTKVYPTGWRLDSVTLHYNAQLEAASIDQQDFKIDGHVITKAFLSNSEGIASTEGRDITLVLDPKNSQLISSHDFQVEWQTPNLTIEQVGAISSEEINDEVSNLTTTVTRVITPVADDFIPLTYFDEKTGQTIKYNLFKPRNYNASKKYPLVLFMHDASVLSDQADTTLLQGTGALSFASTEAQAKHEAFVIAPQYSQMLVNDKHEVSSQLDATVNLVKHLTTEYNIDTKRLYNCGQSMGAMMSIVMDFKYDDMFAASYIVAGQWDPDVIAPLANDKLWIVVSQGDEKAFPGENAMMDKLESLGAKVSRAVWDGQWSPDQFHDAYNQMASQGTHINYVALKKGTVVPAGLEDNGINNHMNTWPIAYQLSDIEDWLFEQHR
jgi:predicted peptidase